MDNSFSGNHYNILLLEDSPQDMELYVRRLKRKENVFFNITEAHTVKQAIDITKSSDFDCFVVDYHLPDADGMTFIKHLFDHPNVMENAAIVMVTGQGNEEMAVDSLKMGAHDYLTKKSISDGIFVRPILAAIDRARLKTQVLHYQEELERSNKELTEFAHTASHDLKSPLRRIKTYCEILESDAQDRLNNEDKQVLNRVIINSNRMQNLIDQLLTFSLINSETEKKEMVDIHALVTEIIDDFTPQIEECEAKIEMSELPKLSAYKTRLTQLFSNLISNALKYKCPERPAHILITHTDQDQHILFKIQDNGLGMSEEDQKQIFKDFKRLHAHEDIEGSGLGLSICKKIVERHEGRIWVEAKLNQGSTFCFTIKKDNINLEKNGSQ